MARKIFNGIKIEKLSNKEIKQIKNSNIIDKIINKSYEFKDSKKK